MSHQQLSPTPLATRATNNNPLPVLTHSRRSALDFLGKAFAKAQPLVVVIGEAKSGASYLVDRYLASLEGDVAVTRIRRPKADADAGMRELIGAIGCDAGDDVSGADMQKDLVSFLSYQRYNKRRTVICFEDTDAAEPVVDRIRLLVNMEMKEKFGLMVILSGRPELNKVLTGPPFDSICSQPGQRIALAPFTADETREHIHWEFLSAGVADVGQVFESGAITLIHKLCQGIPDRVDALCSQCIDLAHAKRVSPVTKSLVKQADELLRKGLKVPSSNGAAESNGANGSSVPFGRLVARMRGAVVRERTLDSGHVLIGRDKICDIPLASRNVSRHHALVVNSSQGACVLDLCSTNGTFISGRRVEQHPLKHGDVIAVGDCEIAYVASGKDP